MAALKPTQQRCLVDRFNLRINGILTTAALMKHSVPHESIQVGDIRANLGADPDEFGMLMGPIMAGARARGVADAFELMGIAAILIDGAGRVLHAGGRAERALLPLVRIVGGHLVGADVGANQSIQSVVESALRRDDSREEGRAVEILDAEGRPRLSLRAVRFPQDGPVATQLLRAVVIVTDMSL